MLVMMLPSHAGHGMMSLLSNADDGIAESTLFMVWHRCRVLLMMALLSQHWLWHDVVAECCHDGATESTLVMA
jgi:hypothetical protein